MSSALLTRGFGRQGNVGANPPRNKSFLADRLLRDNC
jgi:hypothetical protein